MYRKTRQSDGFAVVLNTRRHRFISASPTHTPVVGYAQQHAPQPQHQPPRAQKQSASRKHTPSIPLRSIEIDPTKIPRTNNLLSTDPPTCRSSAINPPPAIPNQSPQRPPQRLSATDDSRPSRHATSRHVTSRRSNPPPMDTPASGARCAPRRPISFFALASLPAHRPPSSPLIPLPLPTNTRVADRSHSPTPKPRCCVLAIDRSLDRGAPFPPSNFLSSLHRIV